MSALWLCREETETAEAPGQLKKTTTIIEPPHDKTNNMTLRPAKTQISLGVHPVWSESSLCAQWVAKEPCFRHADSEDSDQTGWMPRLIWVFAGRTNHFVGFVMRRLIYITMWNTNTMGPTVSRRNKQISNQFTQFRTSPKVRVEVLIVGWPRVSELNAIFL